LLGVGAKKQNQKSSTSIIRSRTSCAQAAAETWLMIASVKLLSRRLARA
jgi:hypothetical protein